MVFLIIQNIYMWNLLSRIDVFQIFLSHRKSIVEIFLTHFHAPASRLVSNIKNWESRVFPFPCNYDVTSGRHWSRYTHFCHIMVLAAKMKLAIKLKMNLQMANNLIFECKNSKKFSPTIQSLNEIWLHCTKNSAQP